MSQQPPPKSQFSQMEEELLRIWDKEQTFAQSLKQREGAKRFSFYDGPPYANGLPHHGHVVPVSLKDSVTRYKTMRGYYVPRRLGWDTHGLPVEYQIEKELGFKSKQDILRYGIDKFNQACRESVFRYKAEWEKFFDRIGRWADAKNAYATMEDYYIESIWWVFAEAYKKGLISKGFRSMPYCPRCATPLSNFELNQGYQDDVEDPSVYVKFKLVDENAYFLAWTTTPWTLPGNAALGVDVKADYVRIAYTNDEGKSEELLLAKARLGVIAGDFKILEEMKGQTLVGKRYQPLFKIDLSQVEVKENLYRLWPVDFVSLEDGTGIVHIAPAFGAEDLTLYTKHQVPVLQTIDEQGKVKTGIGLGDLEGQWFKAADPQVIEYLARAGNIFAAETFRHTYPFCWRCETPLLYYAIDNWLLDVPKIKPDLLKNNQKVNWTPEHIRDGRFGNWLADAHEWGISRNRFWGAPIPVWQDDKGHFTVISSIAELKQKATKPLKTVDMHRPGIDQVKVRCDDCGDEASRIEEIFDVWFESGSMPYAQDHYPFANKTHFEQNFPADFIGESIDQTRGWFYTLHVLATALFNQPASQNIVVSGWVMAADGQKLSKRLKNYVPLDAVFDQYGADTLRFFMLTSPVVSSENIRFSSDGLKELQRNVFMTLWNVYSFFKLYADIDKWQSPAKLTEPKVTNVLDRWILARLNEVIVESTKQADAYQIAKATRPLIDLVDDLSNWYVRRSRRRFWKSEDDKDKQQAYETLHYVLIRVSQLLAPWAPFMSDRIYRDLRSSAMPESVHLTDWPAAGKTDKRLLEVMHEVRDLITVGLAQRATAGIKVRQPLTTALVGPVRDLFNDAELRRVMEDELNVKEVKPAVGGPNKKQRIVVDTKITQELKLEGLAREVVRCVQQYRKESGLNIDDRINLSLATADQQLKKAIQVFADIIQAETLAKKLDFTIGKKQQLKPVQVEGVKLEVAIAKSQG
ncbi:isoleucine--tRNA ligase [Candidatus Microgenomates bacterium]|nr:isoleucine--tRNA ligase [Candidatus Microgenomates bacterium]